MDHEHLDARNRPIDYTLSDTIGDTEADTEADEPLSEETPASRRPQWIALGLFLATVVSTFWAGMLAGSGALIRVDLLLQLPWEQAKPFVFNGLQYSGALILILGCHEMGHYLQAWRYGIRASYPYFLPMPISPFGTMGAVIIQGDHANDRKTLFDIAITGPLAGLVVALPVLYWGITETTSQPMPADHNGIVYGDPLILQWMYAAVHGPLPEGNEIMLTPLLFAGWVGIFITALNLIPVGQLDGGHVMYALIRRRSYPVAKACLLGAVGYMTWTWQFSYLFLVVLLYLMGPLHPPTGNDNVPLGWPRLVLGWLTMTFIILGFPLNPISMAE